MSDKSATIQEPSGERRRRGRRPGDARERRAAVLAALETLQSTRVPFTMRDLAERAGISRATLYRDAGLRDLIGSAGDSPAVRPVDARDFERLRKRADDLAAERRQLRRDLRQAEERVRATEARARASEDRATKEGPKPPSGSQDQVRKEAYAEGFAAGRAAAAARSGVRGGVTDLHTVAARLPRQSLLNARRSLARVLHPDLFAQDPAAALLATELLKQLNALTGPVR
jgi:hypothetical protein